MRTRDAVWVALLAACGGVQAASSSQPAADGVRAYLEALRRNDARSAYQLLSEQARSEVSFEEFEKNWRAAEAERSYQVRSLSEGLKGTEDLGERASVRYGDGKSVGLHREGGAWRLETGLLSQTHAGGPRDAVRIFAEALAARSYDGVMGVLTTRRRTGIAKQVDDFVTSLTKHVEDEIAHIGKDRAELQWDDGDTRYKIILRREGEEWRIDDVNLRKAPEEQPQ
jgi:hypothetical protein